jgi:hypothetical protein
MCLDYHMDKDIPANETETDQTPDTQIPEPRFQVDLEVGPKAEDKVAEGKSGDTDSVRSGLANVGPTLFSFLKREPKGEDKPKEGEVKPKAEAQPKPKAVDPKPAAPKAEDKPKEGEGDPAPTESDIRAEKILGKKPKKSAEKAEPPKEPEPQQMTPEVVANVAARTAAEVLKQSAPKVEKVDDDYPEEYRESAKVFDVMAQANPQKYGKIKQQLQGFHTKEQEYRASWEAKNDGESFDPDADEHAAFYSRHTPKIEEQDIAAAEKALEDAEINAKVDARVQEQLKTVMQPLRANQIEQQIAPVVISARQRLAAAALTAVLPKIDPANITQDLVKEIEEKNPREVEIINAAADAKGNVADAYIRITSNAVNLDQRNPVHAEVIDVVSRVQSFVLSRPRDERVRQSDDGRTLEFAPVERYAAMSQAERARYWTIGLEEVSRQLEIDAADMASKKWKSEREILKKYGAKIDEQDESNPKPVRQASQKEQAKPTTQTPVRQEIKVSRGMSERGGAGTGSETVRVDPKSGFAALMSSLMPDRAKR